MGRQVRRRRDGHGPPSLLTTQRSGLSLTRDVDVLPVFSVSAEGGSSPWSSESTTRLTSPHSSDSDAGRYERGVRPTAEDAKAAGGGLAPHGVRGPLWDAARALTPALSHDAERLRCRHARHEQGLRARVLQGG